MTEKVAQPHTSDSLGVVDARCCHYDDEICDDCGEVIGMGGWHVELIDPDEDLHAHCAEARGWEVRCPA